MIIRNQVEEFEFDSYCMKATNIEAKGQNRVVTITLDNNDFSFMQNKLKTVNWYTKRPIFDA